MSLNKKIIIASIVIPSLFITKCEDEIKNDCKDVMCTAIFIGIVVSLRHASDSSAFILSDHKVFIVSNGEDITPSSEDIQRRKGYYPIADDSMLEIFKFKNIEIEFQGILDNKLIVKRRFIVTASCCHIGLVNGDTKIYL